METLFQKFIPLLFIKYSRHPYIQSKSLTESMPFFYARKVKLLFGGTQLNKKKKTCFTPSLASYRFIIKWLECRKCVTHQNYQKEHELYRKQKVAPIFYCIKYV